MGKDRRRGEAEAKAKGWHTLSPGPGSWQAGGGPNVNWYSAVARVLGPVGRSRLLQKRLRASQPVCVSATEHRLSRASQSGLFQPDTFSLRIQLIYGLRVYDCVRVGREGYEGSMTASDGVHRPALNPAGPVSTSQN